MSGFQEICWTKEPITGKMPVLVGKKCFESRIKTEVITYGT
jgi:hypothetical protein